MSEITTTDFDTVTTASAPRELTQSDQGSGSLPNSSNSNSNNNSNSSSNNLTYILGGAATAGGVVLVVAVVLGVVMFRRRRARRRYSADAEAAPERDCGIYDEISEAKREKEEKEKKKKQKKKKQKGKQTKVKQPDQDNNNDVAALDPVAMDTAPDIITAHDNESIYETLDGRRAARAATKAGHVMVVGQSRDGNGGMGVGVVVDNYPLGQDPNYDHLGNFTKPRFPRLPPGLPEKRFTDPGVVTRPKVPPKPRDVHSADYAAAGRMGDGDGDSSSLRSSLTELARQSVSGGKRIVCQLTMVGVVENGKHVPVRPAAATNTYFILEPSRNSGADSELTSNLQNFPAPKFRIKSELPGDTAREDVGGRGAATAASDYFVLEPLASQQEDLETFVDMPHVPAALDCCGDDDWRPQYAGNAHCSRQGLHSVGSLGNVVDEKEMGRRASFRTTRVNSCPGDCSFTEETDFPPALPPKHHHNYGRSYSSPQSSLRRNQDESPPQRKMDAETLKARIQQEMIALGFVTDPDAKSDVAKTGVAPSSNRKPQTLQASSPVKAPATNNYFILEPQRDGQQEEEEESRTDADDPQPPAPQSPRTKPRYQKRQQPASSSPPPLPKRNMHSRSKSETRLVNRSSEQNQQQSEDQGPVIVSLKKHRPTHKDSGARSKDVHSKETFRPRFRSESGVLSERLKRQ